MDAQDVLREYIEAVRDLGTRRCEDCGAAAECEIVDRETARIVCDAHLVQRFEAAFRASRGPLVAYHPADEVRYAQSLLRFVPASEDDDVEPLLAGLPGACAGCGGTADVLYAALEGVPSGPIAGWHRTSDGTSAAILCRGCALEQLLPALPGRFDAVELPGDAPGALLERPG